MAGIVSDERSGWPLDRNASKKKILEKKKNRSAGEEMRTRSTASVELGNPTGIGGYRPKMVAHMGGRLERTNAKTNNSMHPLSRLYGADGRGGSKRYRKDRGKDGITTSQD